MQLITENQTGDGAGTNRVAVSNGVRKVGLLIFGTFDTASIAVNFSHDDGTTLFPVVDNTGTALAITSNWAGVIEVPGPGTLGIVVSSAGGSTDVTAGVNVR